MRVKIHFGKIRSDYSRSPDAFHKNFDVRQSETHGRLFPLIFWGLNFSSLAGARKASGFALLRIWISAKGQILLTDVVSKILDHPEGPRALERWTWCHLYTLAYHKIDHVSRSLTHSCEAHWKIIDVHANTDAQTEMKTDIIDWPIGWPIWPIS